MASFVRDFPIPPKSIDSTDWKTKNKAIFGVGMFLVLFGIVSVVHGFSDGNGIPVFFGILMLGVGGIASAENKPPKHK